MASEAAFGSSRVPRQSENGEQVEQHAGAEENADHPRRHVAVVTAFGGDREFRIGEGEIDDGGQPFAFDLIGNHVEEDFDGDHRAHRNPERLAADAAVEAVEKIEPVHNRLYANRMAAELVRLCFRQGGEMPGRGAAVPSGSAPYRFGLRFRAGSRGE